jgi:hypothetical protein
MSWHVTQGRLQSSGTDDVTGKYREIEVLQEIEAVQYLYHCQVFAGIAGTRGLCSNPTLCTASYAVGVAYGISKEFVACMHDSVLDLSRGENKIAGLG